jgi:hypothetical protein
MAGYTEKDKSSVHHVILEVVHLPSKCKAGEMLVDGQCVKACIGEKGIAPCSPNQITAFNREHPPVIGPQVGDEVYTYFPGFMGTPAVARGVVVLRRGVPSVQITQLSAMLGGNRPPTSREKYRPLSRDWTKKGEEHPDDRRMREAQERRKAEAVAEAQQLAERQAKLDVIRAQGGQYLDQVTPEVGMKLKNVMTGETGVVGMVRAYGKGKPEALVVWENEEDRGPTTLGNKIDMYQIIGKESTQSIT